MKGGRDGAERPSLPVDPERLRRLFPALGEEELAAYVKVSHRILGQSPGARAAVTRSALADGRRARDKREAGGTLSPEEALLGRYLDALEKMQ